MSEITKIVEKTITKIADFPKVLRDVALGLKNKGFFMSSDWRDQVIQTFGCVFEDISIDDIDEHEISCSFVDEPSKFNKKSKTSTARIVMSNQINYSCDMFGTPSTQATPPRDHLNNDELDSEGFVTMPAKEVGADDCLLQSQIVLKIEEFGKQSPNESYVEDAEATDLEMSKLEWDDSAVDANKNTSASVTQEIGSNCMTKQSAVNDDRSATVTPDLEFEALPSAMTKSIMATLASPEQLKVPNVSFHLDGIATTTQIVESSMCGNEIDESSTSNLMCEENIKIEKIDSSREAHNDDFAQDINDVLTTNDVRVADENKENVENKQDDHDEPFTKPNGMSRDSQRCDVEILEVHQRFPKPGETTETSNQCDVEMAVAVTQMFSESIEPAMTEINRVVDSIINAHCFDETQSTTDQSADLSHKDDAGYHSITKTKYTRQRNLISSTEDKELDDGHNNKLNVDKEEPSRNRLMVSSDDEEEEDTSESTVNKKNADRLSENDILLTPTQINRIGCTSTDNAILLTPTQKYRKVDRSNKKDVLDVAAQKLETLGFESPKHVDWEQLCEKADTEQSAVVFKSGFDQCKVLRIVLQRNVAVASATKGDVIAVQQSVRGRSKQSTQHTESTDVETNASKRQKFTHTALAESSASASTSTKSDDVPAATSNAPAESSETPAKSNNSSILPESVDEDVEENVDLNSSDRQIKATSTPMAQTKSLRVSLRLALKSSAESSTSASTSTKDDVTSDATVESIETPVELIETPAESSKAPIESSNSSISPESVDEDVEENVDLDSSAPQIKATPMEQTKSLRVSLRRQRQAVTVELSTAKKAKQSNPKPRAKIDQPAEVDVVVKDKVSADGNDGNNSATSDRENSTDVVSSRGRKRKATTDILSLSNDSSGSRSSSITRSTRNQNFRVMFTMIDPQPHSATLKKLNISIAETDDYNTLITDKIYRTPKFICALAAGKPIVSINWLNELKTKKSMIDPFEFLLKDAVGEKKYQFSLAKTLDEVKTNGRLLSNYSVLVTPSCSTSPDVLKDIIVGGGGKYLKTSLVPRKDDIILCISDQKDQKLINQLKKKYPNLKEINVEDFMQSIFQYKFKD